jgi:trimeric autotransporter adhesin
MSEINASIIVEPINLTVTDTSITQTVTVEPINLNVFTNVSESAPGGTTGQLQYKTGPTTFGGVANTSVASGNLTFTNLANLKIDGGVNGYVLETDGTGVLNWTAQTGGGGTGSPGGSNTQVQYNDAGVFGGFAGFTFDETTSILTSPGNINSTSGIFNGDGGGLSNVVGANVVGTVATATAATTAGTVTSAAQPNITSTGTLSSLTVINDITSTSGIFNGDGGGLSNIAAANVTGLSLSQIANGTSNVDIATVDGNVDFTVGSANVARMSTTGAAYPGVLAVNGNITAKNDITAEPGAQFVGDGGGLSNISAVGSIIENGTSNVSIPATDGNITFSTNSIANVMQIGENAGAGIVSIPAGNALLVSGNATLQGSVTSITTANIATLNWPLGGTSTILGRLSTGSIIAATAYGYGASADNSGSTAIGFQSLANGLYSTAIGYNSEAKGYSTVAIGLFAGNTTTSNPPNRQVAIGEEAGANCTNSTNTGSEAVAIGRNAGNVQGDHSIAIGSASGNNLGLASIAIGWVAQGVNDNSIAMGRGANASGNGSIAIGWNANSGPSANSISIGSYTNEADVSGTYGGTNAISIGKSAGAWRESTSDKSVAIGFEAGRGMDAGIGKGQKSNTVAIGSLAGWGDASAGSQNINAVALGAGAGYINQGANAIAIGYNAGNSSQAANSIILNATGAALTTATTDTFNVKPVRSILGGGLPAGFKQVAYNPTTGEFIYYD